MPDVSVSPAQTGGKASDIEGNLPGNGILLWRIHISSLADSRSLFVRLCNVYTNIHGLMRGLLGSRAFFSGHG